MFTKVFAKSLSILKNFKYAALVPGILNVVAFTVEFKADMP
jgi:hypothetical protein